MSAEDTLGQVTYNAWMASKYEQALREEVAAARVAGYSWSRIGEAIGVTKQAAQQRYGR